VSVFVIGTIGDTTTQLSLISGNNSEQIASIFSYGIDKTRISDSLATVVLSVPVIFPLIEPYASYTYSEYS